MKAASAVLIAHLANVLVIATIMVHVSTSRVFVTVGGWVRIVL